MQPHFSPRQTQSITPVPAWQFQAVDTIRAADIQSIFDRTLCGIRIAAYCGPDTADRMAEKLIADPSRTSYGVNWARKGDEKVDAREFWSRKSQGTDVDRVGPITGTIAQYTSAEEYSSSAVEAIRRIRSYAAPALSPIDRLRLELDEALPGGARIASHTNGAKAFVGVGRVMESSSEAIHADTGRPGCLTANLYLRLPGLGGGTKVWSHFGDYVNSPGSYLFAPGEIPEDAPCALLEPGVGELVIWNPMNPHVVLPFTDGLRVSIQVWLKVTGQLKDGTLGVQLIS